MTSAGLNGGAVGSRRCAVPVQRPGYLNRFSQEDQGFSVIFRKDVFNRDYLVRAGLSERQISAVFSVKDKGKITNAEFQRNAEISAATSRRDLKDLVDKNILEMKGIGKGVYYVLKHGP